MIVGLNNDNHKHIPSYHKALYDCLATYITDYTCTSLSKIILNSGDQ